MRYFASKDGSNECNPHVQTNRKENDPRHVN